MKPLKIDAFKGINNRSPVDRLPTDDSGRTAVRDAVNVDLTQAGTFQRRPGSELVAPGAGTRNLQGFGSFGLYAQGDTLYRFDGASSRAVATLPSPAAQITYAKTPLGVAWSDGYTVNIIENGISRKAAPDAINPSPIVSASSAGTLIAGTYGVMFAVVDAHGVRSAWSEPASVTVAAGGSIAILMAAQPLPVEVFVTAADGDIFYREIGIAAGSSSALVTSVYSEGQPISHEVLGSLPGGRMLAIHGGRLISVSGPYVFFSQPWSMGLYRPAYDYIALASDVTLVAPVEGGVYLADSEKTYWLPGGDIAATNMVEIAPYGAVRGTLSDLPNSTSLMWFTPRGPVNGAHDGQLSLLQDRSVLFPTASRGASILRETNGLSQFITSLSSTSGNSAAAVVGSYMEARSIKSA